MLAMPGSMASSSMLLGADASSPNVNDDTVDEQLQNGKGVKDDVKPEETISEAQSSINANADVENGESSSATENALNSMSFCQRMVYVLVNFWPLGLIAFGGPTAHIALLRERFVAKLKMLDEETFAELFGLCGAMPGPTSTQLVIALATMVAGIPGGFLAYLMWSMPGFIVLTVAGVTSGIYFDPNGGTPNWMKGLAPSATAQVFVATWMISKSVMGSKVKIFIGLFAACVTIVVMGDARIDPRIGSTSFPIVLFIGGLITLADSRRKDRLKLYYNPPKNEAERLAMDADHKSMRRRIAIPHWLGLSLVVVWLAVLIIVIVFRGVGIINDKLGILYEGMYRIGSIIYGGGQVVLPMLQQENYCSTDQFFQGFALVQALPGPLFNFSAFLGGVYAGVAGAVIGLMGINMPGMLLVFGVLPFWARLRRIPLFKVFITGVTAAGIGLLYTACVQLYESAVTDGADATVFLVSGALTAFFGVPVPISILLGSVLGFILSPGAIGIGLAPYCLAEFKKNNATFLG